MNKYLSLNKNELRDFLIIVLTISSLFSILYIRFNNDINNLSLFLSFFIFIFILIYFQIMIIKYYAFRNGFSIEFKQFYIDRYWFNVWNKISAHIPYFKKGIPAFFFSIILYTISFGLFILPSLYNFKPKKIPHLHVGTQQLLETSPNYQAVSNYRFSKALFINSLYFFTFGFVLKFLATIFNFSFYNQYTFILYYIGIFSLVPIPLTYGYELFSRNPGLWITGFSILIFSFLILLIFKSLILIIGTFIITSIIIIFTILWKRLM